VPQAIGSLRYSALVRIPSYVDPTLTDVSSPTTMLPSLALCLAGLSSALASSVALPNVYVSHEGEPQGFFKSVSGSELRRTAAWCASLLTWNAVNIYHSYHKQNVTTGGKAVLFVSDIYGVPLLENKL
jgi:hypothetical protein